MRSLSLKALIGVSALAISMGLATAQERPVQPVRTSQAAQSSLQQPDQPAAPKAIPAPASKASSASAAKPASKPAAKKEDTKAKAKEAASQAPKDISRYCANIQSAASEASFVVQREALAKVEKDIEDRMKVLEAKRVEFEEWHKRRLEVLERADESVLKIYASMKPESAAAQIAAMDDDIAAGILSKLKARSASAILGEMEPARAAHLANTISDAPRRSNTATKAAKAAK